MPEKTSKEPAKNPDSPAVRVLPCGCWFEPFHKKRTIGIFTPRPDCPKHGLAAQGRKM